MCPEMMGGKFGGIKRVHRDWLTWLGWTDEGHEAKGFPRVCPRDKDGDDKFDRKDMSDRNDST
jgi:hypothetical protein